MAGQMIKKGKNKWLVRVFLGRDEQTGKRKYFSKAVDGNRGDAQKFLTGVLRELDLGTFVEPMSMTVSEYLDKWLLAAAKPRLAERTYGDYEELLQRYVRQVLGNKKLSDLKPLHIQALYSAMQVRKLSPRVVRYVHAVISSAFKQAVKWGMLARNPAAFVDLPKQTRKEMKALSPEEAARFVNAAREDEHGLIFIVALLTGCRPEEYLALQWKDIDLESGLVIIQRTLIWRRKGGGWYYGEPKTAKSRRSIPLPFSLVQDLRAHRRAQAEARLKCGPEWKDYNLVFTTDVGGPLMSQNLFRRHFKPTLKRAELPESIRLYDLRHSCATLLLAAGEHPKVVSERLGHATITLTLDTYAHVLPSMQKAASDRLEALVLGSLAHHRHTKIEKRPEDRLQSVESLVARDGVEPPTRGFSVRCSTN
jgi:integrase